MTTGRHRIPRLFDGAWDSVLICTFGAALDFYERDLARQVERARNRVILADDRQVTRWLSVPENRAHLRQVNRTYVLAPLRSVSAAHAKLILLLGPEHGRLAVGSGNLNMAGYASQGECFTTYSWTEEEPEHLGARSWLRGSSSSSSWTGNSLTTSCDHRSSVPGRTHPGSSRHRRPNCRRCDTTSIDPCWSSS